MKNKKFLNNFQFAYFSSKVNWPLVLGKKGPLNIAYLLANKYIKEERLITATEVNNVLFSSNIKITKNELDNLLNKPRLKFSNLDSNTIRSKKFL